MTILELVMAALMFRNTVRGSEISIGISLIDYNSNANTIQVRLTRYSSLLRDEGTFILTSNSTESSINRYLIELEGYFLSRGLKNGLSMNLGGKCSYLLRSSHESFSTNNGVTTILKDAPFEGLKKVKLELLLKIYWKNIMLSEELSIVPSYVFGLGLSNDFNSFNYNSTALNQRFEVTLVQKNWF